MTGDTAVSRRSRLLQSSAMTATGAGRARGVSLLEGVLYITLALSVLGFSANFISEQNEQRENIQASAMLRDLTDASQLYLAGEYDEVRNRLAGPAGSPGNLVLEQLIPLSDIAANGYYPSAMLPGGEATDVFGQNYAILVRGVNANDGTVPQATLTRADVVDGTGALLPAMIDGNPGNGEYELEAILVSYGGEGVSNRRLGPVTNGTGRTSTGVLPVPLAGSPPPTDAMGPRGGFAFDVTGFDPDILNAVGTADFPQPDGGRFVSLLALSNYGVLRPGGGAPGEGGNVDGVFYRCNQILETPGMNHNSPQYRACLNTNEIYDEIVFNNDFDPGFRSAIRNVDLIAFSNDGLGSIDMGGLGSNIRNLSEIDCATPSGLPIAANQLRVNCGIAVGNFNPAAYPGFGIGDIGVGGGARIEGSVSTGGALSVAGNTTLSHRVTFSSLNGGQDARAAVFDLYRQASNTTVPKPICPAGMTPNVLTSVASYSDPQGRGTVGVTSYAVDEGAAWRLRMVMFVDEDVCDNAALGAFLDPTISPGANGCLGGDSQADAYQVPADFGMISAQTQCVTP